MGLCYLHICVAFFLCLGPISSGKSETQPPPRVQQHREQHWMPTCALTAVPPTYLTERQLTTHKTHMVITYLIGDCVYCISQADYHIVHVTRHSLVLHIIWHMQKKAHQHYGNWQCTYSSLLLKFRSAGHFLWHRLQQCLLTCWWIGHLWCCRVQTVVEYLYMFWIMFLEDAVCGWQASRWMEQEIL